MIAIGILNSAKLYGRAEELDYDCVATGHYARIEHDAVSGRYLLKKAADSDKDQSYVLYMLTQKQLAHTKLPLGGLTKQEVRQIAETQGFITRESMIVRIYALYKTKITRILLKNTPAKDIRTEISLIAAGKFSAATAVLSVIRSVSGRESGFLFRN